MKKKRTLKKSFGRTAVALISFSLCSSTAPFYANAKSPTLSMEYPARYYNDIQPFSTGLLKTKTVSCTGGSGTLYLNATSTSYLTMAQIGFTYIRIQRSSDKMHWELEKTIPDMLKSNTNTYSLISYAIDVEGGYYYRVILTHYAKEQGSSPQTESAANLTSAVWVSK